MSDEPPKKSNLTGLLVSLFLVPILYVLSIGPSVLITSMSGGSHRWFELFYYPLELIYRHQPITRKPLEAYLRLWGVK